MPEEPSGEHAIHSENKGIVPSPWLKRPEAERRQLWEKFLGNYEVRGFYPDKESLLEERTFSYFDESALLNVEDSEEARTLADSTFADFDEKIRDLLENVRDAEYLGIVLNSFPQVIFWDSNPTNDSPRTNLPSLLFLFGKPLETIKELKDKVHKYSVMQAPVSYQLLSNALLKPIQPLEAEKKGFRRFEFSPIGTIVEPRLDWTPPPLVKWRNRMEKSPDGIGSYLAGREVIPDED